ncbi:hypothetical protein TAMA11512_13930 [Selenomonas sp. TAMA-11512]|nr:hypothetical protein TAMA11512_13930 [Selenomonas sp. TAMA-11512]
MRITVDVVYSCVQGQRTGDALTFEPASDGKGIWQDWLYFATSRYRLGIGFLFAGLAGDV